MFGAMSRQTLLVMQCIIMRHVSSWSVRCPITTEIIRLTLGGYSNAQILNITSTNVEIFKYKNKNEPFIHRHHLRGRGHNS